MTDDLGRHFQLRSHDLKNTRDLRSLLLDAAYELQARPNFSDAHIYLHGCTLAKKRVEMEVDNSNGSPSSTLLSASCFTTFELQQSRGRCSP